MDPISIAGSIIGISTAVKNVVAGVAWITALRNAPLEIFDLQNELETIQGYLDVLQRALRPLATKPDITIELALTQIGTCLRVLRMDVDNLQEILTTLEITKRTPQRGTGETLRRIRWKAHKDTITMYHERIRRRRLDLAQAVGLLQPVQSERHLDLLLNIQDANKTNFESLENLITRSAEQLGDSINNGLQKDPETEIAPPEYSASNITVTASTRQQCNGRCQCQCHSSRGRISSTYGNALSKVLGQFFVRYSSIPIWGRRSCDTFSCKNNTLSGATAESLEVRYVFPSWLVLRSLYFSVAWGDLNNQGASLHLRFPRMLPHTHEVWRVIDRKDATRLRAMLCQKEAFPTDIHPAGLSLLGYALSIYEIREVGETLLSFGGNLYRGSADTFESASWALAYRSLHYQIAIPSEMANARRQICEKYISMCGKDEDDQITPVHEAIIFSKSPDQRLANLRAALDTHPKCLDALDGTGATPLHWAINKNDVCSAEMLLDLGADLEKRNSQGRTALYIACIYGYEECVELLVRRGALVDPPGVRSPPLCASATSGRLSSNITEKLLWAGADPNGLDIKGQNALFYIDFEFSETETSARESIRKMDLLLDAGANIDQRDKSGVSPLFSAILNDDFVFVELILERGADVGVISFDGKGLLHYVALCGKRKTMRVIRLHHQQHCRDEKYSQVRPGRRDEEGMTAGDYFKKRIQSMPQRPERAGGSASDGNNTTGRAAVSTEDIEEFVLLVEELQSCREHAQD